MSDERYAEYGERRNVNAEYGEAGDRWGRGAACISLLSIASRKNGPNRRAGATAFCVVGDILSDNWQQQLIMTACTRMRITKNKACAHRTSASIACDVEYVIAGSFFTVVLLKAGLLDMHAPSI